MAWRPLRAARSTWSNAAASAISKTAATSRRASLSAASRCFYTTSTCRREVTSPTPPLNVKFRHKLDFVEEMRAITAAEDANSASFLVGDLNIAPLENDVWSHKQMLKVVSHTPVEDDVLRSHASARRLGRPDAATRAGRSQALHLVELQGAGLGSIGSRPPARPCVVLAFDRTIASRHRGGSGGPGMGPPFGPRSSDRTPGARLSSRGHATESVAKAGRSCPAS